MRQLTKPSLTYRELQRNSEASARPSYDMLPLLYSVMENTVAIHSSLPRENGYGVELDKIKRVFPNGSPYLEKFSRYNLNDENIGFTELESAVVPDELWGEYANWGIGMKVKLGHALGDNPAATMVLTSEQKDMFFEKLAREFQREAVRFIHFSDKRYALKIDMPLLDVADRGYLSYYEWHWPSGFLAGVTLPYDMVKELKELDHMHMMLIEAKKLP